MRSRETTTLLYFKYRKIIANNIHPIRVLKVFFEIFKILL